MDENPDLNTNRLPEDDELFGIAESMLGANRVNVRCLDGKERKCRIPGRMRKEVWIRTDDLVIVDPWDWQDEKGDIVHRYEKSDADEIKDSDLVSDDL